MEKKELTSIRPVISKYIQHAAEFMVFVLRGRF